ncbi:hypothetical protein [Longimicrobium terrae]|uniref:Uncharacterized protein n=1 Tax=Longimicrobium terrae TaxID=1639882 RepID=A0A841GNY7_9BACT|nr:hypothetical protein [Longimicrobium terrae]MBB4635971.1 hypothetical protein [Longimicrobium terrae]MBB6070367.1 hypothetical protein [Longimicrobium terrae]NNC30864.1 hypothetical protein [Longimicrobium terrae]
MAEPKVFTLVRHVDETGVSGTGRILDGVIFHTDQVVVCWRSDLRSDNPGHSSIAIYPSWEAFLEIHVHPHGPGAADVQFQDPGSSSGC